MSMALEHLKERVEWARILAQGGPVVGMPPPVRIVCPERKICGGIDGVVWLIPALSAIVVQHFAFLVDLKDLVQPEIELRGLKEMKCLPGRMQRLTNIVEFLKGDRLYHRVEEGIDRA